MHEHKGLESTFVGMVYSGKYSSRGLPALRCHVISVFGVKMEAANSSETLISHRNITGRHNPQKT